MFWVKQVPLTLKKETDFVLSVAFKSRRCEPTAVGPHLGLGSSVKVTAWGYNNLVACQEPQTGTQRPEFKDGQATQ